MAEQTPQQLGREAGEAIANAIADNLEAVLLKMADAIARVQAEQSELRDELNAQAQLVSAHGRALVSVVKALEQIQEWANKGTERPPRIHPPRHE